MASIFIAEDDSYISRIYKLILELAGHRIVGTASNGENAVEMYKSLSKKPDIIIMDHRMPIKNGIEATKEIFQISRHPKVIFASADRSVKEQALAIGAVYFLEKPFSIAELTKRVKEVLEQ